MPLRLGSEAERRAGVTLIKAAIATATTAGSVAWWNVKAFGAKGDGATDDTAAIQGVLNAANVANPAGATIYFPAGTYMIQVAGAGLTQTPGLKVYSGQRITGDGQASVLKAIAGTNGQQIYDLITNKNSVYNSTAAAPSVVDSKILVDNIAIDGQKAAHVAPAANSDSTAHGIFFSRVKNCTIQVCYVANCYSDAYVYEYSSDSSLIDCISENQRKTAWYASGCEQISFVDNLSLNDGGGGNLACSWYCTATGNTLFGFGSYGNDIAPGIALTGDSRYNTISGNTMSNSVNNNNGISLFCRAAGNPPTVHGITYGDASNAYGASFNTITGNAISKCTNQGIYLTVQSAQSVPANFPITDHNRITGNVISECSSYGMLLEGVAFNEIHGNKVTNNGTYGIRVQSVGAPTNRAATDNKVTYNDLGDYLIQEPGSATKTHNAQTQTTPWSESGTGANRNIFYGNTYNQTFTPSSNLVGTESKYTQPMARVTNSIAISLPNNATTTLTFDTEKYDNDAIHSTSVNTSRLTCNTPGLYQISAYVEFASSNVNWRGLLLLLNGVTIIDARQVNAVNGAVTRTLISCQYQLNAGDYVEVQAFQNSGAALNADAAAEYTPIFQMTRIGP